MVPLKAGVVIVGGGVLGLSAAFHLAREGQRDVVVLDRGPIACGTTPYAAGQTTYLTPKKSLLPFTGYCLKFFENFQRETGYSLDFRQVGSLRVAAGERYLADLESCVDAAQSIGDKISYQTKEQLMRLVPDLNLPREAAALLIPRDGYVDPKAAAVAFAAAARDRGVKLLTHMPVLGLEVNEGSVRGVVTAAGPIAAEWVVLAAGAWTRQIARGVGVDIKSVPVRHQAFVTAPIPSVAESRPIVRLLDPQIYVRPYAGGLLVGGYGYRPMSYDMGDFPPGFTISALEADAVAYAQLAQAAVQYFPVLQHAAICEERRGLPTITPDGRLIVSELAQVKGLVVASGCMVTGIAYSPGVGREVASIVLGRERLLPAAEYQAERFGDAYASDAGLRARCEAVYGSLYWGLH